MMKMLPVDTFMARMAGRGKNTRWSIEHDAYDAEQAEIAAKLAKPIPVSKPAPRTVH